MYPTKPEIARVLRLAGYNVTEWRSKLMDCKISTFQSKRVYHVRLGGSWWQQSPSDFARLAEALSHDFTATVSAGCVIVTAKEVRDAE